MPTPLTSLAICNAALAKIGSQAITSLTDQTSAAAIVCNQQYPLAVREVSRSGRWNCILTPAQLTAVVQPSVVPNSFGPITATPWAPLTYYSANTFIYYGNYYYEVMFDLTSTDNFFNDLGNGYYTQQDQQYGSSVPDAFCGLDGSQYTSSWPYAYALPSDIQLLVELNGATVWTGGGGGSQQIAEYQIMGDTLYCNESVAVIQYVRDEPDASRFDSLFVNALSLKLASMVCTVLRQDGGAMEAALLGEYKRALREARQRNGGEQNPRRFNPISTSQFNRARYIGLMG